MWNSVLLRGFILVVLVTANYNDPASKILHVKKDGEEENIQINVTLISHSQRQDASEAKIEVKATRVNGSRAFSYRLDIQQWRISDAPGTAEATSHHLPGSVILYAPEKGTMWSAPGMSDDAYRFSECDAVLVGVAINVTDTQPIFFKLTPDRFRMSNLAHSQKYIHTKTAHINNCIIFHTSLGIYVLSHCVSSWIRNSTCDCFRNRLPFWESRVEVVLLKANMTASSWSFNTSRWLPVALIEYEVMRLCLPSSTRAETTERAAGYQHKCRSEHHVVLLRELRPEVHRDETEQQRRPP